MAGADQVNRKVKGLSRRELLRGATALGTLEALQWLAGCTSGEPATPAHTIDVPPTATRQPTAHPSSPASRTATSGPPGTATPSATPTITPMPQPESTLTPAPDVPLFDEGQLAHVFVAYGAALQGYPAAAPFDPDDHYPEYPHTPDDLSPDNGAYRLVREALRLMSPEGYGSAGWSPLEGIIRPGDRVLIKPNLVDDSAWADGQITHPAFLRPIVDYAYQACGPEGRILLAEGPWAAGVFDRLVSSTGIQAMVEHLATDHGVPIVLQDLNKVAREVTPLVDLGAVSELRGVERVWYDAHGQVMREDGDPGVGRYPIAAAVLEADVVICVPKAKVHCSSGVTLAMKNMIGIIPAWDGPYQQAELKDCAHTSDVDRAAGPQGMYLDNDTIWRSMADLNRILLYADAQGLLHPQRQRRYLAIVDGIVAAQESQYQPRPYPLNTVVVGNDPLTVDAVTARCMGFDPRLLKSVTRAAARADFSLGPAHPSQVKVVVSSLGVSSATGEAGLSALYRHALTPELHVFSWQGHLEASDFDPPEIVGWRWDAESGELYVSARDPAGVAWVRVAYRYEGRRRTQSLQLYGGTWLDGLWRALFPLGGTVRQATVLAGDELFNETSQEIGW